MPFKDRVQDPQAKGDPHEKRAPNNRLQISRQKTDLQKAANHTR